MSPLAGIDRRDVALTAAAVVLGQVDAFAPGLYSTSVVGPRWVVSVTYLVAALAVLVRRTRPGPAFAVGIGALVAQALTVGTSESNGSLVPAVLLSYSVAVHGSRRVAVAGLCAIPVAAAIREVNNPENTTVAEVLNGLGWDMVIVDAWLLAPTSAPDASWSPSCAIGPSTRPRRRPSPSAHGWPASCTTCSRTAWVWSWCRPRRPRRRWTNGRSWRPSPSGPSSAPVARPWSRCAGWSAS